MVRRGLRLTGLVALAATVLSAAALVAAARDRIADPSVPGWLTSPVVSAAMAVSAVLTVLIGHRVGSVADRALGRWITALGLSVGLYLVMLCVAAWVAGVWQYPGVVGALAVAGLGGHVPVLTLLQLTAVQVHDRMTGTQRGRLSRRPAVWIIGLAAGNYLLGFLTFAPPPFSHLAPPGEGTWFDTGPARLLAAVVNNAWLLVMLVGPVMLWRAARRSGVLRRRVGIAGTASLVPVGLIVLCGLVGAAAVRGGLGTDIAAVLLLSGMSIAVPLTAAGYAVALRPRRAPPVRAWALVGVVALIFAMLATTASIWLGALLGADAVYAVTAVTVLAMTVMWPAQQRLVQWLLRQVDPRRAVAAALLTTPVAEPGPAAERILREATGDPRARLTLCLPGKVWLDVTGNEVAAPPADSPPIVDAAGSRIGAVTFSVAEAATGSDGVLAEITGLVEKATYVAQVHHHATRADRAAAQARQRLERDLHDGVQGRLVALALNLRLAQDRVDDPNARLLLDDAVDELRTAVAELRGLSSGAVARQLSEGGLAPALRDLVARLPVPVQLAVPEQRFPPEVEATAYFVTAEAITNAVKHAEPRRITARLQHDPAALTVLVEDDGRGGADPRAGTGLRGIAERVGALGGRCLVSDRTPTGTRVEVAIPCEP